MSANSFILNTFLVAASKATRYAMFSIVELAGQISIKITNRNKKMSTPFWRLMLSD